MKLKYAIIATIIFNLVLISIFLCRQYKEYHNRKHDYIRIIEASKAKIIKEIENTFNVKEGHTSNDGKITLETKNCFKKCGFAPNVQINGIIYSNCTKKEIVKTIRNVIN